MLIYANYWIKLLNFFKKTSILISKSLKFFIFLYKFLLNIWKLLLKISFANLISSSKSSFFIRVLHDSLKIRGYCDCHVSQCLLVCGLDNRVCGIARQVCNYHRTHGIWIANRLTLNLRPTFGRTPITSSARVVTNVLNG